MGTLGVLIFDSGQSAKCIRLSPVEEATFSSWSGAVESVGVTEPVGKASTAAGARSESTEAREKPERRSKGQIPI